MGWTVLSKQRLIHFPYLNIATTLLVVFCFTPTTGAYVVPISHCFSENSTLARLADCTCYQGGRGGIDGRICGQSSELVDLVCSGVSAIDFPPGEIYHNVTCLEITDSPKLRELTHDQLRHFPNLEGLILLNTGLETITDNLSLAIPYIYDLHLLDGQLTKVPRLGGLNNLTRVSFSRNKIKEIDQSTFVGLPIITLDLSGNQFTELTGNLFKGLCTIGRLNLGGNRRLRRIEGSIFNDTNIQALNLSYTQISEMPYTHNFEGWLSELDLRGTPNLHTFESHRGGSALKGQSFLCLREVAFNYHAHCCQLKRSNYSYYEPDIRPVGKREASSYWDVIQQLYNHYLGRSPSSSQHALASKTEEKIKHKRETIPDENDSLTCLNYTDLNIVIFPPVSETPATEEPTMTTYTVPPTTILPPCDCGGDSACLDCVDLECEIGDCDHYRYICDGNCSGKRRSTAVEEGTRLCSCEGNQQCEECVNFACDVEFSPNCPMYQSICDCQQRRKRNAMDSNSTGETNNITADILPEGWSFHPNSTDLICTNNAIINITTQIYRPCPDENPSPIAPSHTASAVPDISPTPTTLQTDTILGPSPPSTVVTTETSTPIVTDSMVTPVPCSSDIVEVFCTLTVSLPPPPTTVPPTNSAPTLPPCDCGSDFACIDCVNFGCNHGNCDRYRYICDGNCSGKRRRRYITAVEEVARLKRDTTATPLPDGWFYPNPNNTSLACIPISEIKNTTTTTPTIDSSTTSTVSVGSTDSSVYMPVCSSEPFPLDGTRLPLKTFPTICSPDEDPFNPCEDLLGEDHVLRSFIWIVIILAFIGNFLVIFVFLGYTVIIKHTKVKLFVVHFFYFNLALADFIMGIYLFTIAVQDLRTLGNFSMFDVAWRIQGGCDFAGFCAITSTMVSVYVLLVITVERLYTFSRALQKSHISKTVAVILMAVGWGFGLLVGILPVVTNNVNDYTKTAICLPFDVSSQLALSYVLFLLLFTGIVFMVIAICYVIIFYQVFYHQKGTNSVNDKKQWKIELKVALRMGTLVLTNFICWFPIALLGISAAFGNSLVNNITFAKWVMVFIFPINACLNPILYSILNKVFRDGLVLTLGKCGLCGGQVSKIKRHRAFRMQRPLI